MSVISPEEYPRVEYPEYIVFYRDDEGSVTSAPTTDKRQARADLRAARRTGPSAQLAGPAITIERSQWQVIR
jgi:hypothetical protein